MMTPANKINGGTLRLVDLRAANEAREREWCPEEKPDLLFRSNELAGETGEACNVVKKLVRERFGWRGSRATFDDLRNELADVVISADLLALTVGMDLAEAVVAKFNATSEKHGLTTRLSEVRFMKCRDCGAALTGYEERCSACRDVHFQKMDAERFEKAEKLSECEGPVFWLDHGPYDGFFSSLAVLLDYLDEHPEKERPEFVWAGVAMSFVTIDAERVIDEAIAGAPENFDAWDVEGADELKAAIEKFITANQGAKVYDADYTRAVLVPKKEGGAQ